MWGKNPAISITVPDWWDEVGIRKENIDKRSSGNFEVSIKFVPSSK